MDYVTRQFINLTKKFRKDLRSLVLKLNTSLNKQTEAIRESNQASEREQSPPPEIVIHTHLPESIEVHQNTKDTRDERNFKRVTFFVSSLTLGAIVIYADLVYWQYQEMAQSTQAAQKSATEAANANKLSREALVSVQRAFLTFPSTPQVTLFPSRHLVMLQMAIDNAGVTPARGLKDRVSCITPMGPLPSDYTFPDRTGKCGTPWAATGASYIPAKGSIFSQQIYIEEKIFQEFIEQNKGPWPGRIGAPDHPTRNVYFYGWVTYRDVFKDTPEHLTEFCRNLTVFAMQSFQHAWGYCPTHNCTDEECPDYKERIKQALTSPTCCPSRFKESK